MSILPNKTPSVLIRRNQVEQLIGLKKAAIYQLIKQGSFPSPVKIGKRAVAWRIADLDLWVKELNLSSPQKNGGEK